MATTISLPEAGEELAAPLRGRHFGTVEVLEVVVDIAEDHDGISAVYLRTILSDPVAGADTWPLEDLKVLRREVRARANEMDLGAPFYLWFKPSSDPPQDGS